MRERKLRVRRLRLPPPTKASLDLAPDPERMRLVATFMAMVELEPRWRRQDWILGFAGAIATLVNVIIVGRIGIVGIGALNLGSAIVCALGVRNTIRRALERRRWLERMAAMAEYVVRGHEKAGR